MAGENPLEAQAAMNTSYPKSKWTRRLDKTWDILLGASVVASNPTARLVEGAAEKSAAFSLVEHQVSNFVENSKALMAVLHAVGKAHPFVSAAVSIFAGALTLELNRRHNDQKVLALLTKMCDMMSVIGLLKDLDLDDEGKKTIEDRLRQRLVAIINTIECCAKLCEAYQKRHIAVKFFTSLKWKDKFTDLAAQFDVHKADLQFDLQIYVGITVANVKTTLAVARQDMSAMMTLVFEKMLSPKEHEFAALVASLGGAEKILANDALLRDLLVKFKPRSGHMLQQKQDGDDAGLTPSSLRVLLDDFVRVLRDLLAQAFDQIFNAVLAQLEEIKQVARRESSHGAQGGPHKRIVDRPLPALSQSDSVAASGDALQAGIEEAHAAIEHHSSLARAEQESPTSSVMEERLARVEAKLDAVLEERLVRDERAAEHAAFVGEMNTRMGRLEALLAQLIGAQTATS